MDTKEEDGLRRAEKVALVGFILSVFGFVCTLTGLIGRSLSR